MTQKRKGAIGKYSPERVETICRIIARTGSDKQAYQAAGIGKDTFYSWLREKPDFSEQVARARKEWYAIDEEAIVSAFRAALVKALDGVTETWTNDETTTLPTGDKVTKTSVRTVQRGPAEWAVRIVAPQVTGKYGVERKAEEVTGGGGDIGQALKDFADSEDG